ncbi:MULTISPECIES: sodium:solute symporter family transporter [Flavobacteriaceae]|uniref:Sodium transporter n=2 Tax=Flavobacteriaceae TaxID=49546 RepID=A0A4Y8AUF6_9FLAO|nr:MULTISPECIES: sodium/solute symporter [Flavobacteriaceae]TEW75022.1 sodium transporter [Gramella jeungdoensis]GGK42197.1 sodium:solute symporter [Lutibacter litoralis]
MKRIKNILIVVLAVLAFAQSFGQEAVNKLDIVSLPSLPAEKGVDTSLGYAGMLGGVHNEVVVVAGGANFPNGLPWEGGKKVWSKNIYILESNHWRLSSKELPIPLAYSASVSTENGILCIGGDNEEYTSDKVFLLSYNSTTNEVEITEYPELPEPIAYTSAVVLEDFVYVVGGKNSKNSINSFYRLNLKSKQKWEKLTDFPGPPRAVHSAVIQETSTNKKLFVIGGRNQKSGQKSQTLTNYLSYDFKKQTWQDEGDIIINDKSRVLMGASPEAMGSMHIILYGGSDEVLFDELENISLQLDTTQNDAIAESLKVRRNNILNNHPGFSKDILGYNTITKKWFVYDSLTTKIPVTALAFKHNDDFTIVSGELSPGIRTPNVKTFKIAEAAHPFGIINYTVLALYLLISVLIGLYFARKQKSTKDYFTGGGRIPWWASGLSVFGTLLSAITFMAIPAKAFVTDWSFFFLNITAILITPVIAFIFIPFFNKLKIKTAYEYLEDRFNYKARAFGSLSFILFQLGRIGIVLLLPSLAISIVTGIPVETSIIIMGLLCILYTTFGGIEAVIWTDVMQVVVLLGGSILAVIWIMLHTETSFVDMISYASERDKFNLTNMEFNFTESTFWVVFLGGLASAMVTQGTDQTIVQRFLTSSSIKDSQKTLYTNAVLTLPATIIFFGIGTLLFIFYTEMPNALSPAISNNDSIFPWYIVRELPIGVSGLLVAGIFSAAMSSISSSLNSVSTAYCNDFHSHFKPNVSDMKLLRIARMATIITGVLGLLLALWMASSNIKSLWDQFYRFLGLFTGGLGGMFLLGMLTKKANAKGTLLGLLVSAIVIWYISVFTEISFLMYSFFGVVSCFTFGYVFSLIFSKKSS